MDTVSPQALGSDIEYPLRSNALSAKSILGGRVALTQSGGGPRELEWAQLCRVVQSGLGGDDTPDNYQQPNLPLLHTTGLSHILLQVGPYYEDLNGEYRGEVGEVMDEGNEGGNVFIE